MNIHVECQAGYQGEEEPRRFYLGKKEVAVTSIQDRWLSPDHRYFKIIDDEGGLYVLRHNAITGHWEMTLYDRGEHSLDWYDLPEENKYH